MKRVRDFHSQSWNNPFFGQNARPPGVRGVVARIANIAGFVVGAGILIYVFAYSPLLRINKIEIVGNKTIDPVRVKAVASQATAGYDYLVFPKNHYFSIGIKGIENIVLLNFSNLRQATIKKRFGKIVVTLEEKQPTYRLIVGDKSYILDQDGAGLHEAAKGEGDNLIALSQDSINFSPNINAVPALWVTAIFDLHKYFATQIGVRDQLFKLDQTNGDIKAITTEGWYAIFDPLLDIKIQLETLSSALLGKFKPDERKKLLYVDVRYGDKVYYKWR